MIIGRSIAAVQLVARLLLDSGALNTLTLHPRWTTSTSTGAPGPTAAPGAGGLEVLQDARVLSKRVDSGFGYERSFSTPIALPPASKVRPSPKLSNKSYSYSTSIASQESGLVNVLV